MVQDFLLQLTFLFGGLFQSFLLLRHVKNWKKMKWIITIWIIMFLWMFGVYSYAMAQMEAGYNRGIFFGLFIWIMIVSISFFKEWFPRLHLKYILIHTLTFFYAFAIYKESFELFVYGSLITCSLAFLVHYGLSRLVKWWYWIFVILYLFLIMFIGILQTNFGELYLIIDPMKEIHLGYIDMFLGGMLFQFIGMHFAMIFSFWSLMWGGLATAVDKKVKIGKRDPKVFTLPEEKNLYESLDIEYEKRSLSVWGWLIFVVLCGLYYLNFVQGYFNHVTFIYFMFVIFPQIIEVGEDIIMQRKKKS